MELCPDSLKEKLQIFWMFSKDYFVALVTSEDTSLNHDDLFNKETSTNFLKLTATFDFIVSLVIARSVLNRTLPVTQLLQ